ncbi:MAG: hypothetical protein FJ387_05090 [Verrucomicrobia bacterium]|nr:hypothetical protein [Verrucomicrobiota bacterium]
MNTAPSQPEPWLLLRAGLQAPALNMAWDEALLEAAPTLGQPLLRLYAWSSAAATFGYAQRYAEVAGLTPLRPLIRRPTGGGLVLHGEDWTYSLVFPPTHPWYRLRARESYQRVHAWLRQAFDLLAVLTELAVEPRVDAPGQCFVGAEQFDLLWQGSKIAGAAQRRTRSGLLVQGSVQPPAGLGISQAQWQNALCAAAERAGRVRWSTFVPAPELAARATVLAAQKYATAAHSQRR